MGRRSAKKYNFDIKGFWVWLRICWAPTCPFPPWPDTKWSKAKRQKRAALGSIFLMKFKMLIKKSFFSRTNFHRLRGWRMSNLGYCLAQPLPSTEWWGVWLLGVSTGVACVWAPVRRLLALQYPASLTYHAPRYCLQCWRLSWIQKNVDFRNVA